MKKLITILSILTLSLGIYANDLKTSETLVTEYTAAEDKAAYITANTESIAVIFNNQVTLSTTATAVEPILISPYALAEMVVSYANSIGFSASENYTFKTATAVYGNGENGQGMWLDDNNISYDVLKSNDFVYDGWKLFTSNITNLAIDNNDYTTFKANYTKINNSLPFIKTYLMTSTDTSAAYTETQYWESKFILEGNTTAAKEIQAIQDIIYLRIVRENNLK